MGRADYAARRAARIARLEGRAAAKAADAAVLRDRAAAMAAIIPLGQPILVGHHSEGRDRRYRAKIDRTFTRSLEAASEAAELARRADAAARNAAISSDDPEAVDKLLAKLAQIEAARATMRAANAAIRAHKDEPDKVIEVLKTLGYSEALARELMVPDFAGRIGFPDYRLTNTGAEARRLAKRIAELEAVAARPAPAPILVGDVRVEEADNRVRIVFPGKPSEEVRSRLKSRGFRWAPSEGAWQRQASNGAWSDARWALGV